jgi:CubicO group peptidase (beta-lactamase class C family)
MSSGTTFNQFCTDQILRPTGLADTTIAPPGAAPESPVTGHGALGSPMADPPAPDPSMVWPSLYTTAADLGRLIELALSFGRGDAANATGTSGAGGTSVFELLRDLNESCNGHLGLAVAVRRTDAGDRVEVWDSGAGQGCLMRWYPGSRDGVVVLYNSATGSEAAQRIAQLALGGD